MNPLFWNAIHTLAFVGIFADIDSCIYMSNWPLNLQGRDKLFCAMQHDVPVVAPFTNMV